MRRSRKKRKVTRKESRVLPFVGCALVLLGVVAVGRMLVGNEGAKEEPVESKPVPVRKVHRQQAQQTTHLAPDHEVDEPLPPPLPPEPEPQPKPQPKPVVRQDSQRSEEVSRTGQEPIAEVRTHRDEPDPKKTDTEKPVTVKSDTETPQVSVRTTEEEVDEPSEPTKEQVVAEEEEKREPRRKVRYHPARCSNSVYSLSEAARAGDVDLVRKRLQEGYPVNLRNEVGMTPLHLAVQGGRKAAAQLLISRGADVLAKDKQGRLPIDLTENEEIKALLKEAEKVRTKELEVFADIKRGETGKLREMLAHGMSPEVIAEDGLTCLLNEAALNRNKEAVRILIKAGARLSTKHADGKTPLHAAAMNGDVEMVQMLLKAGADPMEPSDNGSTALHDAVWTGKVDVVRVLLPLYKKVNFSPILGWVGSPIEIAIRHGKTNMVQEILKAGLKVNSDVFEEPLLVSAAKAGNVEIVKMLLKAHARKDAKDSQGKDAADYASGEVARLLK